MDDIERKLRDLGDRTAQELTAPGIPRSRIVRRARLRRAAVLAAPVATVVLAAAVVVPRVDWPGTDVPRHAAALADAVTATEQATSARMEMEIEFVFDGDVLTNHASGEIDFETGRAHLVVEYSEREGESVVETIIDGTRTFERPAGSPGAKWREASIRPPGAETGPAHIDPRGFLRWIESTAEEVTRVGTEVRDGVSTTRYRAILDPEKVQAATGTPELPEGSEVRFDPMDVWVDAQGRLREVAFGTTSTIGGLESTVRGSMRLFDFGVPVDVEVPTGAEVTDDPLPSGVAPPGEGPASGLRKSDLMIGASWFRDPYVIVNDADGPTPLVCVETLEDDPVRARLQDRSGRTVLTIRRGDFTKWRSTFGAGVGCVETPHDHVRLAEPESYILTVEWEGGRAVVPLEDTVRPVDETE